MLSFLKQKLGSEVSEGESVPVGERVDEGWSQDIVSTVSDLRGDIYDHIRTIRDPEKPQVLKSKLALIFPQNLEELGVVVEDLVSVYPVSG